MSDLNWDSYGYDLLPLDNLEDELKIFSDAGFDYYPNDTFNTSCPAFVDTPTKYRFTRKDIEEVLSDKLIFGNLEQIEALRAAQFFQLAQNFYNDRDDFLESIF